MISVVTVFRDKERYLNSLLKKSLKKQKGKFEVIEVDIIKEKIKSEVEALNYGGGKAKGDYIIFMHSDIDFISDTWLKDTEKILDSIGKFGAAGTIGMSEKGRTNKERGRNMIVHKVPPRKWEWGNPIEKPEPIQTMDESMIIIPKSIFEVLKFDNEICDEWHLFAVDYCLSCKRLGLEIYAIPMPIYHQSAGSSKILKSKLKKLRTLGTMDDHYYRVLKRVLNKHKKHFKEIYTTCGNWRTDYSLTLQRIYLLLRRGVRYKLLGKLLKN